MVHDLFKYTAEEVRKSEPLTAIYIDLFKQQFGYEPSCVPCTFNSDFNKLKMSRMRNTNIKKADNTFVLKAVKYKILSYLGKDKKIRRSYDNNMTEDFAVGYLSNGTKEEIEERKKLFKVLPKSLRNENKSNISGTVEKGSKTKKRGKS